MSGADKERDTFYLLGSQAFHSSWAKCQLYKHKQQSQQYFQVKIRQWLCTCVFFLITSNVYCSITTNNNKITIKTSIKLHFKRAHLITVWLLTWQRRPDRTFKISISYPRVTCFNAGACWESESVACIRQLAPDDIFQFRKLQTKKNIWLPCVYHFVYPNQNIQGKHSFSINSHQVSWLLNFLVTTFPSSSPSRSAIFCDRSGCELPLKIFIFGILGWSVVPIVSGWCTVFFYKTL